MAADATTSAPPPRALAHAPYVIVLALVVAALALRIAGSRPSTQELPSRRTAIETMSTVASLTTYGATADRHDALLSLAKGAFDEVEAELSLFRPDSILARLNAEGRVTLPVKRGPTECDPLRVVAFALEIARETNGAFDPTVNPLMRLWGFRKGAVLYDPPSEAALSNALGKVGYRHVGIVTNDDGTATVTLDQTGVELDLGGIAKGYAVDLAYDRLVAAGAEDFLIDLGGNIRAGGSPRSDGSPWRIGVRDPGDPTKTVGDPIALPGGYAVATSGSYERYVEIGGRRYSHIIDPRTGLPVARGGSVSVVAPTAMEADARSTARFVGGDRTR